MVKWTPTGRAIPRNQLDRFETALEIDGIGVCEQVIQVTGERDARHLYGVPIVVIGTPAGLHGVEVVGVQRRGKNRVPSVDAGVEQARVGRAIAVGRKSGSTQEIFEPLCLFVPLQRIEESAVSSGRRSSAMLLSVTMDRCISSTEARTISTVRSGKISSPCATSMPWAPARSRNAATVALLSRRTGSQTSHQTAPSSGVGYTSVESVQSARRLAARISRIASIRRWLSRRRPALSRASAR